MLKMAVGTINNSQAKNYFFVQIWLEEVCSLNVCDFFKEF
jgi:hypothetical protein